MLVGSYIIFQSDTYFLFIFPKTLLWEGMELV